MNTIISKSNADLIEASLGGYKVLSNGIFVSKTNKTLKLRISSSGYYGTRIRIGGASKNLFVHRLQAYQKYGNEIFEKGIQVRHLNGNKLDNSWDNIAIGTQSENRMDIAKSIRIQLAIRASYVNRRFTNLEIQNIISDHNNGSSYSKLCEKYNTSKSTLSYLFNKALYTH